MKLTVYVFAFDCAWIDTALSGIVNVYGLFVDESTSVLLYLLKLYQVLGVAVIVTPAPVAYSYPCPPPPAPVVVVEPTPVPAAISIGALAGALIGGSIAAATCR